MNEADDIRIRWQQDVSRYRGEIAELRGELLALADELDALRQKYAYLVERCAKTGGDQLLEIARLKAELERLTQHLAAAIASIDEERGRAQRESERVVKLQAELERLAGVREEWNRKLTNAREEIERLAKQPEQTTKENPICVHGRDTWKDDCGLCDMSPLGEVALHPLQPERDKVLEEAAISKEQIEEWRACWMRTYDRQSPQMQTAREQVNVICDLAIRALKGAKP